MDFSQSVELSSIKRIVLNQLHVKKFLRRKESKVINSFKLNGLRNFGMIKKIYYKQLQLFLNELIKELIKKIWLDSFKRYGAPKITIVIEKQYNIQISQKNSSKIHERVKYQVNNHQNIQTIKI